MTAVQRLSVERCASPPRRGFSRAQTVAACLGFALWGALLAHWYDARVLVSGGSAEVRTPVCAAHRAMRGN